MAAAKTKKNVRVVRKSANSPVPLSKSAACGHSHCDRVCKVRYCGPTTSIADHHAFHAARGVMHVWTASIIAGLAVVLTGTIAYTAAEAKTTGAVTLAAAIDQVHTLTLRTQQLEGTLRSLTTLCGGKELPPSAAPSDTPTADDGQSPTPKPRPTSCVEQCTQATMSCLKKAGENSEMRQGCARADRACRVSCAEDKSIQ